MYKRGKVKIRQSTGESIISSEGREVLQWSFGVSSIFQLVPPSPSSEEQSKEDNYGEQKVTSKNGMDGNGKSSTIQFSFDFDIWSKLPDEREKG